MSGSGFRLLIIHTHYGKKYYPVTNQEDLFAAAKWVVECRNNNHNYPTQMELGPPPTTELSPQDILSLPEGKVRDYALKEWDKHVRSLTEYQKDLATALAVSNILESTLVDDTAWRFLLARNDRDEEGVELVALTQPWKTTRREMV